MDQQPNLEARSQELQAKFEELLESGNVYYNPPLSKKIEYDAIVYDRSKIENTFANDYVYRQFHQWEVTVITEDPDAPIIYKISRLPMCTHDRHFVSDNLHHNVFTLYH